MNRLEGIMASLEYVLENKRKRHILGGILMSVSMLFAGLAVTTMSMREKKGDNDEKRIE
ncbi:MAG: histidine kinase [Ruminococcus sp.]|nr:histidine kinase [Ruminococcus sp.]